MGEVGHAFPGIASLSLFLEQQFQISPPSDKKFGTFDSEHSKWIINKMGTTSAERMRKLREKVRKEGKYKEYRQKESAYHQQWYMYRKGTMTSPAREKNREKERLKKQRYRMKKR